MIRQILLGLAQIYIEPKRVSCSSSGQILKKPGSGQVFSMRGARAAIMLSSASDS